MLSEEKIKLMTKLAVYEKHTGKKTMKLTKFFQMDYVGWNMLKTGIAISIGYLMLAGAYVVYHLERFVEEMYTMDYMALVREFASKYVVLLVSYMAVTFLFYNVKYSQGMKSLKRYQKNLKRIETDSEESIRSREV